MAADLTSGSVITGPCQVDTRWGAATPAWVACGEPSAGTLTAACVHEHVYTYRICAGCATDMQHAAGTIGCFPCWNSPEPHECPSTVVIDWDGGEKTIVQEARNG